MAITQYRVTGSRWKGTYTSYSAYFRPFVEYSVEETTTHVILRILKLGAHKEASNSNAEWTIGSAKSGTLTVPADFTGGGAYTIDLDGVASVKWTSNSAGDVDFIPLGQSGIIPSQFIIEKELVDKSFTVAYSVKKNSGAWSGNGSGTITINVPAKVVPSLTVSAVRDSDTQATVTVSCRSFAGDTISSLNLSVGNDIYQIIASPETVGESGVITRTVGVNVTALPTAIAAQAVGSVGQSAIATYTLQGAFRTFHFGGEGKSVGFGRQARSITDGISANGNFDCAMDANFTGSLMHNGIDIFKKTPITITGASGYTIEHNKSYLVDKLGMVVINVQIQGSIANGVKIMANVPEDFRPPDATVPITAYRSSAYWITGYISTSGDINVRSNNAATNSVWITAVYWIN